jgi:hypothetical protein
MIEFIEHIVGYTLLAGLIFCSLAALLSLVPDPKKPEQKKD